MSKFIPEIDTSESLLTSKKEAIQCRRGSEVNKKGEVIEGWYQIDLLDTTELLTWLAEKAPLFHSTKSLDESYKNMRTALLEIMEAVSE